MRINFGSTVPYFLGWFIFLWVRLLHVKSMLSAHCYVPGQLPSVVRPDGPVYEVESTVLCVIRSPSHVNLHIGLLVPASSCFCDQWYHPAVLVSSCQGIVMSFLPRTQ